MKTIQKEPPMKSPFRRALFAFVCLASATAGRAQSWERRGGPEGGAVNDLVAVDGKLWAVGSGAYFSADSGKSWEPANRGLPSPSGLGMWVGSVAAYGGGLLATGVSGILSASGNGDWSLFNDGLPAFSPDQVFAEDVLVLGGTALIRSSQVGVFRRRQGDGGWANVTGTLPMPPFGGGPRRPFAIAWGRVLACTHQGGIDYSADTGTTWNATGFPRSHSVPSVQFDPDGTPHLGQAITEAVDVMALQALSRPGTLLAGTRNEGVYFSRDSGTSWTRAGAGLPKIDSVRYFPVTSLAWMEGTAYAIVKDGGRLPGADANAGLYRSADSGRTWLPLVSAPPLRGSPNWDDERLRSFGNKLFLCGPYGIWLSPDGGMTWSRANRGLTNQRIQAIAVDSADLYAGTDNGIYHSADEGRTWELQDSTGAVQSLLAYAGKVYAGTPEGVYTLGSRSGAWKKTLPFQYANTFLAVLNGKVHAWNTRYLDFQGSLDAGMVYAASDGEAWTGIPEMPGFSSVIQDGSKLYVGASEGVFASTDSGATWSLTGLKQNIFRMGIQGHTLFAFAWNTGKKMEDNIPMIYRSTDGGAQWREVTGAAFRGRWIFGYALEDSLLMVGTDSGAYYSLNGGDGWAPLRAGLDPDLSGDRMSIAPTLAGGKAYLATRSDSRICVLDVSGLAATPIAIAPGPHKQGQVRLLASGGLSPVLWYEIPGSGSIRISMHDLRGKEVGVLAQLRVEKGIHPIMIPAGVPLGRVYRLSWRAEDGREGKAVTVR
ncbi:MAG: two component regulator propeller domain protein [Fibrobacteres bacterium]|nr:two component regulator propeller domain protein [Fibrobacterota bacterium]